jgi:hypothetical protein
MESEEMNALAMAAAPLAEGKAATEVMPAVSGEGDPMALVATLSSKTKIETVDIVANILKIGIALGLDSPELLQSFMGSGEEEATPCGE